MVDEAGIETRHGLGVQLALIAQPSGPVSRLKANASTAITTGSAIPCAHGREASSLAGFSFRSRQTARLCGA